jgi:hypothetical protein
VVESRARRKRRQDPRSSAYYGSTGLAGYSNILYGLGPYGFGTNIFNPILKKFSFFDFLCRKQFAANRE